MLDEFADALLNLANRAYPELDPEVRMHLACNRFVASMRADYVQENLLQTLSDSLEVERRVAKHLEAAWAEFDFSLEHRPGKCHQNADALSRFPCHQCSQSHVEIQHKLK